MDYPGGPYIQSITSVLIRGRLDYTQKRRHCDHRGRDRSDAAINQGMLAAMIS